MWGDSDGNRTCGRCLCVGTDPVYARAQRENRDYTLKELAGCFVGSCSNRNRHFPRHQPRRLSVHLTFTGEEASDQFGRSVAGAGDGDNDGYSDLIVGADSECDGAPNEFDVVHAVAVGFRNETDLSDPDALCPKMMIDVDCDDDTDVFDVVKLVNVAFCNDDPAANFCDPCAP